jgi:hypothetical protein
METPVSITIEIAEIEPTIKLHLNNAGASLSSQQTKYAAQGLISAAIALALSELVVKKLNNGDAKRFQSYVSQATKLVNAYWEDFGLVLLQSSATQDHRAAKVEIKTEQQKAPKTRQTVSDDKKQEIAMILADGCPSTMTKTAWMQSVAERFGVGLTTVYRVDQSLGN